MDKILSIIGKAYMIGQYTGLHLSGNSYYIRYKIPKKFETVARSLEIRFSLCTLNKNEAIKRWKAEFTHLNQFFDIFEEITMEITKGNELVLDEVDVDKILLYRLEQIQKFLEENTSSIQSGTKGIKDIEVKDFQKKSQEANKNLMKSLIVEYLKGLVDGSKANITLRSIYTRLREKEIELGFREVRDDGYAWLGSLSSHLAALERYAQKSVNAIKKEKSYMPSNPKVVSLLRTYDTVQSNTRINGTMSLTHWQTFFKTFARNKKNRKGTCQARLDENYLAVKICFLLIGKEYVEEITKQDCRKLSDRIYRVPKRWNLKLKTQPLSKVLSCSESQRLSKTTINGYLQTFKEFLRFAVKEDLLENNLNEFVDMPVKIEKQKRTPFETSDLRKMFDLRNYPDPHCRNNMARFWVPLICLYHGCRLNEVCQLDVSDIRRENNIPCISINEEGDDKTVKNETSVRVIPIHPQLIEMGFLDYVKFQKKSHKQKLFSELTQIGRGRYSRKVQSWFKNYLQKLGLKTPDKVFHSFRYTFACKAIEKRIPTEYQNALGGWSDYGIGQRLYGHQKKMKDLYTELCKIDYPIKKELTALGKEFKSSYVFN